MEMQKIENAPTSVFSKIKAASKRRTIGSQLRQLFGLSAVLVLFISVVASVGFSRIEERASHLSDLTRVALLTASINSKIYNSQEELGAYRDQGFEPARLDLAIGYSQNAIDMNAQLRDILGTIDPSLLPRVTELDKNLAQFQGALRQVGGARRGEIDRILQPLYAASYEAGQQTIFIRERVAEELVVVSDQEQGEIGTFLTTMVFASLIALIIVGVGFRFVSTRVAKPIQNISKISSQVAAGDSSLDIPETERQDEIGTLARTLSVMQANSAKLISMQGAELEHQQALSKERAKRDEMMHELAAKFETMIGNVTTEVASATTQLQTSADSMFENAEKSSQESGLAAKRLEEASSGVLGAAAASDEFVLSVNEISKQASGSAKRARTANEVAGRANETITELDETAIQVSGIVDMISDIAQRTNLLALNASIEAARGGEAGRGFAVVASEVKELAMQTSKATDDVEAKISAILKSSTAGADALREIVSEVTELERTAIAIASAVDQQSVAGQNIAQSIDVAASNTNAVNENVNLVSELSSLTQAAASQVKRSAEILERQTGTLGTQVEEFLRHIRTA